MTTETSLLGSPSYDETQSDQTENVNWYSKAAIIWDPSSVKNDIDYWDSGDIEKWIEEYPSDGIESNKEEVLLRGISYDMLHSIVTVLSSKLLKEIEVKQQSNEPRSIHSSSMVANKPCLVVAVAIPEGFYLPIAISTVYAMNKYYKGGLGFSVALLPLDPTEGVDRVHHILQDAQPYMILTASAMDIVRLENIIVDISAKNPGPSESKSLISPLMIDIPGCVHSIVKDTQSPRNKQKRECLFGFLDQLKTDDSEKNQNCEQALSHIVYTSGTTGMPKGCVSSMRSLEHYIEMKNRVHGISSSSTVLLASSISFDPCLSDVLATFAAFATLGLTPRQVLKSSLHASLRRLEISHILCTPTLWSSLMASGAEPIHFPCLKVVALGGEPIPPRIRRIWARKHKKTTSEECYGAMLLATYGVTEACVYQTAGEICYTDGDGSAQPRGQDVGRPFPGMGIRVCSESEDPKKLLDLDQAVDGPESAGEVILYGRQVDSLSSYLNQDSLSRQKFLEHDGTFFHRTGDRGIVDRRTGNLHILGRIEGETGMVKFNGVRLELGEIENALVDSLDKGVVVDSIAGVERDRCESDPKLVAYVVLSRDCLEELKLVDSVPVNGAICMGPLLTLLRERCRRKCRVVPNMFIVVPRIPLSPTGKRDRNSAPLTSKAVPSASLTEQVFSSSSTQLLKDYSRLGAFLAEQLVDCLNLHASQQGALLTTKATFDMLGGDSLAATRVVRALYSHFHGVANSRLLGGAHGILDDDRFSPVHLIQAPCLGDYADFLDRETGGAVKGGTTAEILKHRCSSGRDESGIVSASDSGEVSKDNGISDNILNEALLEVCTRGHAILALALLEVGADPNFNAADTRNHRLGKVGSRNERKQVFASTPLHHACLRGNPILVQALLDKGAKTTVPDASGMFPVHLAAGGRRGETSASGHCYWACVSLLLDQARLPLTMKDGNGQTIFHCAARSGQDVVLEKLLERLNEQDDTKDEPKLLSSSKHSLSPLNWRDRWSRTAVHWAVINGHLSTLQILLSAGCHADPVLPHRNKSTSAALERPLDLCDRVYMSASGGSACSSKRTDLGMAMKKLLEESMAKRS